MSLRLIALDISHAATGVAWNINHRGEPGIGCHTLHAGRTVPKGIDHERIHKVLVGVRAAARCRPDLATIEWLPQYEGHGEATLRLAELHGVIRHWLYSQGVPQVMVMPTHLQMWATGRGRATKTDVLREMTAMVGKLCHIEDHNSADALSLLTMTAHAYGQPLVRVLDPRKLRAANSVTWPELATAEMGHR